jgi:hypothetical protein
MKQLCSTLLNVTLRLSACWVHGFTALQLNYTHDGKAALQNTSLPAESYNQTNENEPQGSDALVPHRSHSTSYRKCLEKTSEAAFLLADGQAEELGGVVEAVHVPWVRDVLLPVLHWPLASLQRLHTADSTLESGNLTVARFEPRTQTSSENRCTKAGNTWWRLRSCRDWQWTCEFIQIT